MLHKTVVLTLLLVATIVSWACPASGEGAQSGQVEIKPGDVVEVISDRTKFMLGSKVLATLDKGSQLHIQWVEDGWIGGQLSIGGEERIGWIRKEDVKRVGTAPRKNEAPTSSAAKPKPTTTERPAKEPQSPVVKKPAATKPAVKRSAGRQSGFARVASDILASNGGYTTEVLMVHQDRDLARVESSEKIGTLVLIGRGVTNKALKDLSGVNVRMLNIDGAKVTNFGLKYLEDIKGLRAVRLWSTDLTDSGLARITKLAGLESLDIEGADIRGPGLRYLKGLNRLRALALGPGIKDAELKQLEDLTALEELDLRSCRQITDAGLDYLGNLKKLQRIAFPPQITREAEQSLGKKLPKCEFFR